MQIHAVRKNYNMHKQPHKRKNSGKPNKAIFLLINPPTAYHHQIIKDKSVAPMFNPLQPMLDLRTGKPDFKIVFESFPHICNHQGNDKTDFKTQTVRDFFLTAQLFDNPHGKTADGNSHYQVFYGPHVKRCFSFQSPYHRLNVQVINKFCSFDNKTETRFRIFSHQALNLSPGFKIFGAPFFGIGTRNHHSQ